MAPHDGDDFAVVNDLFQSVADAVVVEAAREGHEDGTGSGSAVVQVLVVDAGIEGFGVALGVLGIEAGEELRRRVEVSAVDGKGDGRDVRQHDGTDTDQVRGDLRSELAAEENAALWPPTEKSVRMLVEVQILQGRGDGLREGRQPVG